MSHTINTNVITINRPARTKIWNRTKKIAANISSHITVDNVVYTVGFTFYCALALLSLILAVDVLTAGAGFVGGLLFVIWVACALIFIAQAIGLVAAWAM